MDSIIGEIKTIIYRNEENGFTVLELIDPAGDEITAVGPMPLAGVGERVELTGTWTAHKVYGRQLKVESCKTLAPATLQSLISYLGSGQIKGVGEATARSIVAAFGMDTLRVLEEEAERLMEIPGIGRMKAAVIAESFHDQRDMREVMLALQDYGITVSQATKIYRIYGPLCLAKIRENPYRLIDDVESIGFRTADKIAQNAGVEIDSAFRLRAGLKYTLQWARNEGHTCLPRERLVKVASDLLGADLGPVERTLDDMVVEQLLSYKLVGQLDMVFLPYMEYMEQDCARRLLLMNRAPTPLLGIKAQIEFLERQAGVSLAAAQHKAVELAMESGVLVITGGPGTGKTTILQFIIHLMENLGLSCELCAPTGRAAKRMSEAAGFEARTMHRLLEYSYGGDERGGFRKNEDDTIDADMIIVDEVSMVDVPLMQALLKAVARGTRLILVGDADQLPSVGPGNVLRDIIASEAVPVVRLTDIYRQSERSMIVVNAHAVNEGKRLALDTQHEEFCFEEIAAVEDILRRVAGLCAGKTNKLHTSEPRKDVQVLSPMKKGPLGVYNLNARLQEALNPPAPKKRERRYGETLFREGDKVMQVKNDYRVEWTRSRYGRPVETGEGVYNGDLATIMKIDGESGAMELLFDDERCAVYDFNMLEELELAYCISIHKSQGSEFPVVILPLAGGPPMLMTRNLLYTAITRARRQVYILGHEESVNNMVRNNEIRRRYSSLSAFLKAMQEAAL